MCVNIAFLAIKRNGKSKTKQSEYEGEYCDPYVKFTSSSVVIFISLLLFIILEKIRVGRDYQAVCPPLIPEPDRKPEVLNDRALLVWSPTKDIPDTKRKWELDF